MANRPSVRNTSLKSKIPRKQEKIPFDFKIQLTDPLVSLPDLVRDALHVLIVETFVLRSAAEFLCERQCSLF